jgi:hypothetical protein
MVLKVSYVVITIRILMSQYIFLVGFYLLRNIPSVKVDNIPPHDFDSDALSKIKDCLSEVKRKFSNSDLEGVALEWWLQWEIDHAPTSDSAAEYVAQLKRRNKVFHTPLAEYLFGNEAAVSLSASWKHKLTWNGGEINPGFQWPELLAAALPSVMTEFSPNPPGPRLYTANQSRLSLRKAAFTTITKPFYDSLILRREKEIASMMNQKIQPSGNTLATGGKFIDIINDYANMI